MIKGSFLGKQQAVEVKIIKQGNIVKTYNIDTPFEISYHDENISKGKTYYRLEIKGKDLHVITNPIFLNANFRE